MVMQTIKGENRMKLSNRFQLNPLAHADKLTDDKLTDLDMYIELFIEIAKETDNLVKLKGNILLNQLLRETARLTKDLDFDVSMSVEQYNRVIVPLLTKFAERLISEGKADEYTIREISENTGGDIKIFKRIGDKTVTVYSVDTNIKHDIRTGSSKYVINNYEILGSSLERILADKCLATLSYKRFRRIKDFYDIFIILNSDLNFDVSEVLELMVLSTSKEEVKELLEVLPFSDEIMKQSEHAWKKFSLTRFSGAEIGKPNFINMYDVVTTLYDSLLIKIGD